MMNNYNMMSSLNPCVAMRMYVYRPHRNTLCVIFCRSKITYDLKYVYCGSFKYATNRYTTKVVALRKFVIKIYTFKK